MPTLGQQVIIARTMKGWKQLDLCKATGLSQKHISQIENDHVDPRVSVIRNLAGALDVSFDFLLGADAVIQSAKKKKQKVAS